MARRRFGTRRHVRLPIQLRVDSSTSAQTVNNKLIVTDLEPPGAAKAKWF
jgi:hypothetical protein